MKPYCGGILVLLHAIAIQPSFSWASNTPLRRQSPRVEWHEEHRGQFSHRIFSSKRSRAPEARSAFRAGTCSNEEGVTKKFRMFAEKNFFLLGMFFAVGFARLFPSLGTNGVWWRPELMVGKFGVGLIFFLSGLSLELSQLKRAFSNVKLNSLIQLTTFGIWPLLVGLPLTRALALVTAFPKPVLDGILIMTCLPTTVNMCVILTTSAGGNVASALCNAVISNMIGIALTPALLYHFFGARIQVSFPGMVSKLCRKVLLPVAVGQLMRNTPAKTVCERNGKTIKRSQELVLLSILWTAFCSAFTQSTGIEIEHGLRLLFVLPVLHIASFGGLFVSFKALRFASGDIVAASFVGSQKTLAFGLPLINTIFSGDPNLAAYCAPIMFLHPLQLLIGSALLPRLTHYIGNDRGEVANN